MVRSNVVRIGSYLPPHQKLHKIKKNLTRRPYVRLLAMIGQSEKPLSSYKIKNKIERTRMNGRYVYEMIRELAPLTNTEKKTLLFAWDPTFGDTVGTDVRCDSKVIKSLKRVLKLDWLNELGQDELVHMRTNDDKTVSIIFDKGRSLKLKYSDDGSFVDVLSSEGKTLRRLFTERVKRKGQEKLFVYDRVSSFNPKPIRYLDIALNDSAGKRISNINEEIVKLGGDDAPEVRGKRAEIQRIENDSGNFVYSLNFRGFLLYLAGMMELEENRMARYRQRHGGQNELARLSESDTAQICGVLDNLAKSSQELYMLFSHYQDVDNSLEKITDGFVRHHTVIVLKKSASELRQLIEHAPVEELLRFAGAKLLLSFIYIDPLVRDGTILQYVDKQTTENLVGYKNQIELYLTGIR